MATAGRKAYPEEKLRKPRSFVATDDEWTKIKAMAKEKGVSTGEYIRQKLLGKGLNKR